MGRIKKDEINKKVRVTITIDRKIEEFIKQSHINLSSLTNELLLKFLDGKKKIF